MGKKSSAKKLGPKSPPFATLADSPDLWATVTEADLDKYALRFSYMYGETGDEQLVPSLMAMYAAMVAKLSPQQRMRLMDQLSRQLPVGTESVNALLPFLREEPDLSVISGAAINIAMLMPASADNPLAGPNFLGVLAGPMATSERMRVGILSGLLLLGDRRVIPLLDAAWTELSPAARSELTGVKSGFIYAAMVDFFVKQLDGADEETFGALAGYLGRLPLDTLIGAKPGRVLDVERHFPATLLDQEPGVRLLQDWSVEEYGQRIAPQLCEMAERESHPKVLPTVLRVWGIDPPDTRSIIDREREVVQHLMRFAHAD